MRRTEPTRIEQRPGFAWIRDAVDGDLEALPRQRSYFRVPDELVRLVGAPHADVGQATVGTGTPPFGDGRESPRTWCLGYRPIVQQDRLPRVTPCDVACWERALGQTDVLPDREVEMMIRQTGRRSARRQPHVVEGRVELGVYAPPDSALDRIHAEKAHEIHKCIGRAGQPLELGQPGAAQLLTLVADQSGFPARPNSSTIASNHPRFRAFS